MTSPVDGGCWFCFGTDVNCFTTEFDAYLHRHCLMFHYENMLDAEWEDRECEIIAREFGLDKMTPEERREWVGEVTL